MVTEYIKHRVKQIQEGILYMMLTHEETRPLNNKEFEELLKFVDVLALEKRLYIYKTKMILDLFDLVLNYDPTAPDEEQTAYRANIQEKIKLVKRTIGGN